MALTGSTASRQTIRLLVGGGGGGGGSVLFAAVSQMNQRISKAAIPCGCFGAEGKKERDAESRAP